MTARRAPAAAAHSITTSVSKTCLVRFDSNKYSVAAKAVGRPVDVHAYADRLVIRQDGEIVTNGRPWLAPGDLVRIIPNHACVVSNLVDEAWIVNGGEALDTLRIAARGRIT